MIIDDAIHKIRSMALRYAVPSEQGNLWGTVLTQLAARDSICGEHADTLLQLIRKLLARLSDEDVVELWRTTEAGMFDEPEEIVADFVRIAVEDQVLSEVITAAGDEAEWKS